MQIDTKPSMAAINTSFWGSSLVMKAAEYTIAGATGVTDNKWDNTAAASFPLDVYSWSASHGNCKW